MNYGFLKLRKGDYTEAEKIARRTVAIAEKSFGKNSTKLAPPLTLMAEVYTTIGDYEKAETNIIRSIQVQEAQFGREHIDVAKSLTQLALVKFYQDDDPGQVEKLFDEARNIIDLKLGNRAPKYADLLKDLAVLYIATNRYDDAFNSLSLAQTIWETKLGRRNNINAAEIYLLTGDIYYSQRNYPKAEEHYLKAKKLYEKIFKDNHPEYVKVLSKLSKVYYMDGGARKARNYIESAIESYNQFIKEFFPALSEREKAKFWNTIKGDYEFFNTLAVELMDEFPNLVQKMYNNALTTKALLLNSSIKIRERIINSGDEELINDYNNWLEQKEQLTDALSMSPEQLTENEIDPGLLTTEVEQLEKQLSEKSELFGSSFEDKTITWENVRSSLKPNEIAIEMVRFRYFNHVFTDSVIYAGLYVRNDKDEKKPKVFLIKNGEDLENKYFKVYRNSMIFKVRDRMSNEQYWKPIEQVAGTLSTIYFSADGVYNQINLEAIPTEGDKYVIDNSNIILVSNTKDIYLDQIKQQQKKEGNDAQIFGNPEFYVLANASKKSNIGQLPGTENEINDLYQLLNENGWDIERYMRNEATEDQIKKLDNPKVFHIATHGFYSPTISVDGSDATLSQNQAAIVSNPLLRTGLLLRGAGDLLDKTTFNFNMEDGILTAYEAMNLNLDQTDLVILSACETGLGDLQVGEGVYGLQRAFIVAGARTLIMSMFKVSDEATRKLM
ncbi:MAG: CHAT domain-containing tetratricopeptide repeat protein, partial [Calditrichia bacterium]